MSRKRKHEQDSIGPERSRKRAALDKNKLSSSSLPSSLPIISHPVLSVYFPAVLTLRDYFSTSLSQLRTTHLELAASNDTELETLLNTTIVAYHPSDEPAQNIKPHIIAATQQSGNAGLSQSEVIKLALHLIFWQARKSSTIHLAGRPHPTRLYEDNEKLPNHVFAFGHRVVESQRKSFPFQTVGLNVGNEYPNTAVNMLRRPVWGRVLKRIGVEAMVTLVVGRCVFMPLQGERAEGRYYQISGPPISYKINNPPAIDTKNGKPDSRNHVVENGPVGMKTRDPLTPGAIEFFRRRIMHANAVHNKHGDVKFGLNHNHALNRFADDAETLLMYIFPREYKLHNVFTSEINWRQESTPVRDYTSRDEEIAALQKKYEGKDIPVPKRLQTRALQLVRKLQKRHKGCSYHALVKFYCPQILCDSGVKDTQYVIFPHSETAISTTFVSSGIKTQPNVIASSAICPTPTPGIPKKLQEKEILHKPCFTDFANPPSQVCAFVRAVINTVIPYDLFGTPENRETVLRAIDIFIRLRRRETLSIHYFLQGLKLTSIPWLAPNTLPQAQKLAKPDAQKRINLLSEFLYYLVDSFVIPLLRSHFYVTESSAESNRLFFFRHDVWRKLTEPQLERLKMEMFRPVPEAAVKRAEESKDPRLMNSRGVLDVVRWRLTPKEAGVRMIMNLGRKKLVERYNFKYLEKSINDNLKPINYVLTYETNRNPSLLGSSMFTPDTLYPRLKSFRASLHTHNLHQQPLYFVKLDIKSCFDTIPQKAILDHISDVLTSEEYRVMRHEEMLPQREITGDGRKGKWVKPFVKVVQRARDADNDEGFERRMRREKIRAGSVVVDGGAVKKVWEKKELELLLRRHVKANAVKIGKKYYTPKTGIPQGSAISTMLCNLFYAHLENQHFSFLYPLFPCSSEPPRSLLARMTDDFLLITLDRDKAQRFLNTMHTGIAAYGATVNPDKTLVNFDTTVGGRKIRSLSETFEGGGGLWFPYCGLAIHTRSLEVRKQRDRKKVNVVKDTITIKTTSSPGRALIRSTLTAFKARIHPALFDTTFNSRPTVVKTLYHRFMETAMKFHCHVKTLDSITSSTQKKKKIGVNPEILKRAIKVLCADVYSMLKSRAIRTEKRAGDEEEEWKCSVLDEGFVRWLGLHAFAKVLGRKQSRYRGSGLVEWVKEEERRVRRGGRGWVGLRGLGRGEFAGWKY